MDFVFSSGGIEYAIKEMNKYVDEAIAILHEFEKNPARNSLENLIKYTVSRTK
jgi:octaprenyl-diphosphate synthase